MKRCIFLMVCCLWAGALWSATLSEQVETLKNQVHKLNNQVDYLVSAQNDQNDQQMKKTLQNLRGMIEVNQNQLDKLDQTMGKKFAAFEDRLAELENKLNNQAGPRKGTMDAKSKALYKKAMQAVDEKNYHKASRLFAKYANRYPVGEYASESLFMRGQVALAQNHMGQAYERFQNMLKRYPLSDKAPKAYLRLGMIDLTQNRIDEAKHYFNKIMKKYPDSKASDTAQQKLEMINDS
jgi:tol-pal system protein YbgF